MNYEQIPSTLEKVLTLNSRSLDFCACFFDAIAGTGSNSPETLEQLAF
jgi:hypothetical protein